MWLTLKDGTKFTLAEGVDLEGIKAGEEVTVSYEMKDGQKVATEVAKDE
jgi:Cu/Ag efflux protein CusF